MVTTGNAKSDMSVEKLLSGLNFRIKIIQNVNIENYPRRPNNGKAQSPTTGIMKAKTFVYASMEMVFAALADEEEAEAADLLAEGEADPELYFEMNLRHLLTEMSKSKNNFRKLTLQ